MDATMLSWLLVAGLLTLFTAGTWFLWRAWRSRQQRDRFIRQYRFPPGLRMRLASRHPHREEHELGSVLAGLRQYFLACLDAPRYGIAKTVAMPSKAVDEAWHEFILMTRDYHAFCRKAFGRYLHHTPKQQQDEPLFHSVANTLHLVRRRQAQAAVASGAVPLVFSIDRQLGIRDGYLYDAKEIEVVEAHRRLLLLARRQGTNMDGEVDGIFDGIGDGSGCGSGCGSGN